MGEPQVEQNARNLPGEDSYSRIWLRPSMISKYFARTGAVVANAVPFDFWHCRQWQKTAGPSWPVIRNLTAWHKQLPVSMASSAAREFAPVYSAFTPHGSARSALQSSRNL